jgi:uncharacterized protein
MITTYLKPTNFCNVDCAHCYLPASVRANKEKMTDETMHKVMTFLTEMKKSGKHDSIFLIWHGGEPLVLSERYFENAGKIIDQYFQPGELFEAVQTSLIPYRREFAKVVKERWGSAIGSSMDFDSRIVKGSPEEYQKLWMKKVELARSDDILVIPGITPNKKDCVRAEYIFNWFKDRDFWMWGLDRYSNVGGILPEFSTNREHAGFLIELFDLCVKSVDKTGVAPHITTLSAAFGGVLYDNPGDRWGGTCQSDFVVVNPDGRLNNCPDKDSFEESYGNINTGFKSFTDSPLRKKWIRIQQVGHRIDECYECENSSWCKSGCPITGNACEINGVKDECSGFKSFITHVREFSKTSGGKEFMENYMNKVYLPEFIKNNNVKTNVSN